jgi:hypothetical protein
MTSCGRVLDAPQPLRTWTPVRVKKSTEVARLRNSANVESLKNCCGAEGSTYRQHLFVSRASDAPQSRSGSSFGEQWSAAGRQRVRSILTSTLERFEFFAVFDIYRASGARPDEIGCNTSGLIDSADRGHPAAWNAWSGSSVRAGLHGRSAAPRGHMG